MVCVPLANRMDAIIYTTPPLAEKFCSLIQERSGFPDFADTEGMRKRRMDAENFPARILPKESLPCYAPAGCCRKKDLQLSARSWIPNKESTESF